MQTVELAMQLIKNDLRLIRRDSLLVMMMFFALVIAMMMRFLLPWLDDYLFDNGILPNKNISLRLADIYPMLVTFFAFFNGAQISGAMFGFILLDEKDQRTLSAMQVTPVPMQQYLIFRLLLPTVLGFVICSAMILIINQSLLPLWQILITALAASLMAPIVALYLACFAENKIQGFAIAKLIGVTGLTILFGWFVAQPMQWLFGLFPPFLIHKAYWMAYTDHSSWWLILSAGIILQCLITWWLSHRFQRGFAAVK